MIFTSTAIWFFFILGIAAVSGYFSEKAGIVNIAIEGVMVAGATGYTVSGYVFTEKMNLGNWAQVFSVIIAIAIGILGMLLHSFVTMKLRGNQVISGTAINLLMAGFATLLTAAKMGGESGTIKSGYTGVNLSHNTDNVFGRLSVWLIIAMLVIIGLWFLSQKTRWGIRMKAVGENPHAVSSLGVSVQKVRLQSLIISGALAGFAGALFSINTANDFYGSVNGYGFIALALLIFGQWNLILTVLASIFFGVMVSFASNATSLSTAFQDVPSSVWMMLPYILSLLVLVITSKNSHVPKSLGKPYYKTN